MSGDPVYEGGCLCSAIRFRAKGPPLNPHLCSCDQCRRHSGSRALAWVEFGQAQVEWVGPGGVPALYRSSPWSSRAFCPRCGSTLGAVDDEPTVALCLGGFDSLDDPALRPSSHSFADRLPPGHETGAHPIDIARPSR